MIRQVATGDQGKTQQEAQRIFHSSPPCGRRWDAGKYTTAPQISSQAEAECFPQWPLWPLWWRGFGFDFSAVPCHLFPIPSVVCQLLTTNYQLLLLLLPVAYGLVSMQFLSPTPRKKEDTLDHS